MTRSSLFAVVTAATMVAAPAFAQQSITVSSAGGAYQEAQRKALFTPTAKELGITIKEDTTTGINDVRLQVAGRAVKWDLAQLNGYECARGAKEGLFEPIDYKIVDTTGIDPRLVHPEWVAISYTSLVLIYNTKVYGENGPKTWADFWDVKKFPGRRALSHVFSPDMLSVAAMADGVQMDKVYPLDMDRALKSFAKIKNDVSAWWTSGAQATQLVKDGEVDMASIWNGRASALVADGAPVRFSYDQAVLMPGCIAIPKGAPNKALAMKALANFLKPELQADFSLLIANGPANQGAFSTGKIPPERAAQINSSPDNAKKQVLLDPTYWADNLVTATEKLNEIMQR
ncbi:MAG: ABC transporter substrate-binding protein [Rhizobiales bacterium 65-9]|nr:ABC transporter substrate-binding protein [Hyphomicrobiales bacterium]OJY39441.1 MAG: ABC transporter substrate-binding protein [Rhizobiales bacterium 65-9]